MKGELDGQFQPLMGITHRVPRLAIRLAPRAHTLASCSRSATLCPKWMRPLSKLPLFQRRVLKEQAG